jgi:DNA mismatch repair ATPase MutL
MASKLFYVALILVVICSVVLAEKPKQIGRHATKVVSKKAEHAVKKSSSYNSNSKHGNNGNSKYGDNDNSNNGNDGNSNYGDNDNSNNGNDDNSKYGDNDNSKYGDDNRKHGNDNNSKYGDDDNSKYSNDDNSNYGDENRYGDNRKKGYGHEHHEAPAIKSAKIFKLCTYTSTTAYTTPVCTGTEDSCMIIENAKCFSTIYGSSLQVNLVGNTATILYFPANICCQQTGPTTIVNNIILDTCFADPDTTSTPNTLSWRISRIRF